MATAPTFTGVKVIKISANDINKLYKDKTIELENNEYPNLFLVVKSDEQQSALVRVDETGTIGRLISDKISASGVKPRNKEQYMALDMLLDPSVPVNIMTGAAGTGKSLLAIAAALHLIEKGAFKRIILSRPMSQVGSFDLGSLPGTIAEKFHPYLGNFQTNLSQLGGRDLEGIMQQYDIECIPIQLMRGSSFTDALIIFDEVQILNRHEMLTIGTRTGERSKVVLLGDLNQRDIKIAKSATGLYQFMNSKLTKESKLVAGIELLKIERSETAALFAKVLEEKSSD